MNATFKELLAALFFHAPKCDRCDHVATRWNSDERRCDRDHRTPMRCASCMCGDHTGTVDQRWCTNCGSALAWRADDCTSLEDLPHAEALRAANSAHDGR